MHSAIMTLVQKVVSVQHLFTIRTEKNWTELNGIILNYVELWRTRMNCLNSNVVPLVFVLMTFLSYESIFWKHKKAQNACIKMGTIWEVQKSPPLLFLPPWVEGGLEHKCSNESSKSWYDQIWKIPFRSEFQT